MASRLTWRAAPSSNFSATDEGFVGFLKQSLEALRTEQPEAYRQMCLALHPRRVLIDIDGEQVEMRFGRKKAKVRPPSGDATISARTSKQLILDLIDHRLTLAESIVEGRFEVKGHLDDLVAFHDGLIFYLSGGVRARSFPKLLRGFRALERKTP